MVGGGYPIPGLGWGSTPARSEWCRGVPGVPPARSGWWGGTWGYSPGQVWMVRGTQGTPPSRPGWSTPHPWDGVPPTIQTWLGYPPSQTWDWEPSHPPSRPGGGAPPLDRAAMRRAYASCVHAGGLSCCSRIMIIFFSRMAWLQKSFQETTGTNQLKIQFSPARRIWIHYIARVSKEGPSQFLNWPCSATNDAWRKSEL